LRFNFVVAAYLLVRFTPQFLRALHLELFTKPSRAEKKKELRIENLSGKPRLKVPKPNLK
jgi:hypothetical protein